jgi:Cysteine-rich CPCC
MHDWFQWYVQQTEKQKSWAMYHDRYICPCCFMPTLQARAAYDACEVCDWEDDGQDSDDADVVRGGPNGDYSLREARENFKQHVTMYRPADSQAFAYELMDRRSKEQLVRNFTIAILCGSDEHWQKALGVERELAAERTRQDRASH